ncbi:MAG: MAPEG family protein [Variovorax sp.]|nr:MAPEG family protein [Variovorax sp.]
MSLPPLSVAYWCVLVAAVLPYVSAYIAKAGAFNLDDNKAPREWSARQGGWRARANSAQANGFEGLPFFVGAVVIAHQLGAAQATLDMLALAYVVLRMAYIAAYISGIGTLRSGLWALGFMVNIAILFAGR